ncbi:MAG: polyphosphate kinase [Treponema sp.]|nr:polyphosphate kinase [Treponema sp.]
MENIDTETSVSPLYLNRELSWLDFNARVLEEALRKGAPLLERLRFMCITASNFDEFFMIRVASIKQAILSAPGATNIVGATEAAVEFPAAGGSAGQADGNPAELLKLISKKVHKLFNHQFSCLHADILPALAKEGLEFVQPDSYTLFQMDYLESFFVGQIYPLLTPLRVEENQSLPSIESRSVNAAFLLVSDDSKAAGEEQIAIVRIPASLNRIILLPKESPGDPQSKWALLYDVLLIWGSYLFPGYRVKESMLFKVNRDADFSVDERRDEDFLVAMTEVLEDRGKSTAVQMLYSSGSDRLRDEFALRLSLGADDLYEVGSPYNIPDLQELMNIPGFDHIKEQPWKIYPSAAFSDDISMWDRISQGDVMLHLPYQSFDPVVRFFQEAASDPAVISIKTTLYRTSGGEIRPRQASAEHSGGSGSGSVAISPIVRALETAALNGKQVTALVELKARFDEERNISWANRLERAGVIVVYGLSRLKVHAKITLVMRRESGRINRYVHLSTGNYNDKTAKQYEDICLFTNREDIAYDAGLLFNMLTGYSDVQTMRRLVLAPSGLKHKLIELIDRETKRTGQEYSGKIMAKLNSLTDTDMIDALYRASRAGVNIQLCVRGICTLVPGVPGLSDNIRVISIIDHYLEHSRVIYFANGGNEELYLSSADWMSRNLERRVELMFPVQDKKIITEIYSMLNAYFNDRCQARELRPDGTWRRVNAPGKEKPFRVQKDMLARAALESVIPGPVKQEFKVRRSQGS